MMTGGAEGAERLAEILREIFALSETNRPNHSKSAAADDSMKSVDPQCASGIHQICTPHGKQAGQAPGEPEDQHCHR